MQLSDDSILRSLLPERYQEHRIEIEPWDPAMLQPASVDLKLGNSFRGFRHQFPLKSEVDLAQVPDDLTLPFEVGDEAGFLVRPGDFVLGTTKERIKVPPTMCAKIEGKSSIARLGLCIHVTGGFIDPGFNGQITLEIANLGPLAIRLRPGLPVAQIGFTMVHGRVLLPYGSEGLNSHYQGQEGATESRYGKPEISTERHPA